MRYVYGLRVDQLEGDKMLLAKERVLGGAALEVEKQNDFGKPHGKIYNTAKI